MIKYYRNADAESEGGSAPSEEQVLQNATEETNQAEPESEDELGEFKFELDDDDVELPSGSQPEKKEKNTPLSTDVVSKKEYEELKFQLAEANSKLEQLQKLTEHPIMQKTTEFLAGLEVEAEADPSKLYEELFGLNVSNLSLHDLVKKNVLAEAKELGVNLSIDQIEYNIQEELDSLESETNELTKARKIKALREKVKATAGDGAYQKIQQKLKDRKDAEQYWNAQGETFLNFLNDLVQNGKKDFGLQQKFTELDKKLVLDKIQYGIWRYKKDNSIDVKHATEVMLFADNPTAYIKKLEEKVKAKMAVENLQKRTGGTNISPNDPASFNNPQRLKGQPRDLTKENPLLWDPRKAQPTNSN